MTTLRQILTGDETLPGGVILTALGHNHGAPLVWRGDDDDRPTGGDTAWTGYDGLDRPTFYKGALTVDVLETATHLEVYCTTWGDYVGDDLQRSNHRSLLRDFPDTFVDVDWGSYDTHSLAMDLDQEIDHEDLLYVVDILRKLADDYPLYDEEDHSELESELEESDWESHGAYDLRRELQEVLGDDDAELADNVTEEALRDAWLESRERGSGDEWFAETAVSGAYRNFAEVAQTLATRILAERVSRS